MNQLFYPLTDGTPAYKLEKKIQRNEQKKNVI